MPEHVSIEYEHSGACPICGMALVPVTKSALKKLQPGGTVLYYTCPMPEHSDVHEDKPGKCPQCGMTLIPVMQPPEESPGREDRPGADTPEPTTLYTCPMSSHAYVVSDQPGLCPDCEMKLVPTGTVTHGKAAEERWHRDHAE